MTHSTKRRNLKAELLEAREQPAVTAAVTAGGTELVVTGDAENNRIEITRIGTDIVVRENGNEVGRFAAAPLVKVQVRGGDGNDVIVVDQCVLIPTQLLGEGGDDRISGGGATNTLDGGAGDDILKGGLGVNTFNDSQGTNQFLRVGKADIVPADQETQALRETTIAPDANSLGLPQVMLIESEVEAILNRASAASSSNDAIIAILDRNGRVLGVRVEDGVAPEIRNNPAMLTFAIDGAIAKARTGAFFGNNAAPLTSRTIQNISESTITQREVEANPNIADPNSTDRGPGFVANTGINAHFPHGVAFTPQVDLFQIEHTNRDGSTHPGADGIRGTADDVKLAQRFDLEDAFVPDGQDLTAPDSFGVESGLLKNGQGRGIATLPGGIPILKLNKDTGSITDVVGGIGVFFPGKTGFATEENSSLATTFDPTKPDRTLEAEYIAFAALGGFREPGGQTPEVLGGVALPGDITPLFGVEKILKDEKLNSIYLVGLNLEVFGPGIPEEGVRRLAEVGNALGKGPVNGTNQVLVEGTNIRSRDGKIVPEGWLVRPHDGDGITAVEVEDIINRGIEQADLTRAAIRLPLGNRSKMVFAVADKTGKILGLYRMPDATIFSIDVAVAKARNVAYYADADTLQAIDRIDNVAPGTAFTNRSFRYLGEPRYPLGIDGTPPGPFSQLNDDPGIDRFTGLQVGPRAPASQFRSVVGNDSFNPGTNFHDPNDKTRQNGIVFFPGSAPLYKSGRLIGGFGVSGDGVDQDDVVTDAGQRNFGVPLNINRVDQIFIRGVRVPYQKNLRNPEG